MATGLTAIPPVPIAHGIPAGQLPGDLIFSAEAEDCDAVLVNRKKYN
jgi:hypothetical protein